MQFIMGEGYCLGTCMNVLFGLREIGYGWAGLNEQQTQKPGKIESRSVFARSLNEVLSCA